MPNICSTPSMFSFFNTQWRMICCYFKGRVYGVFIAGCAMSSAMNFFLKTLLKSYGVEIMETCYSECLLMLVFCISIILIERSRAGWKLGNYETWRQSLLCTSKWKHEVNHISMVFKTLLIFYFWKCRRQMKSNFCRVTILILKTKSIWTSQTLT